jgi:zinc protease
MRNPAELSLRQPRGLVLAASLTALLALAACGDSQPTAESSPPPTGYTLLETVEAGSSELVIPYQKFQLDNGLTVIVAEDHSDPLVHVDVTYHVGSAREEPQRSGFAHFFEHMMFQGSEHVADEEHIKTVTEARHHQRRPHQLL